MASISRNAEPIMQDVRHINRTGGVVAGALPLLYGMAEEIVVRSRRVSPPRPSARPPVPRRAPGVRGCATASATTRTATRSPPAREGPSGETAAETPRTAGEPAVLPRFLRSPSRRRWLPAGGEGAGGGGGVVADPLVLPGPVELLLVAAGPVDRAELLGDLLAVAGQPARHLERRDVDLPLAARALRSSTATGGGGTGAAPATGRRCGRRRSRRRTRRPRRACTSRVHRRHRRDRPARQHPRALERVAGQRAEADHGCPSSSSSSSDSAVIALTGQAGSPARAAASVKIAGAALQSRPRGCRPRRPAARRTPSGRCPRRRRRQAPPRPRARRSPRGSAPGHRPPAPTRSTARPSPPPSRHGSFMTRWPGPRRTPRGWPGRGPTAARRRTARRPSCRGCRG